MKLILNHKERTIEIKNKFGKTIFITKVSEVSKQEVESGIPLFEYQNSQDSPFVVGEVGNFRYSGDEK